MKIAHLSDIHFFKYEITLGTLFSKRLLGTLNYYFNRKSHTLEFDPFELPRFLKEKEVTHLVITGDFTTTSTEAEFEIASKFIKEFENQGFRIFLIPGNHDCYTKSSEKQKRFYKYLPASLELREEGLSYLDFGGGYKCITLDTTIATPYWSSQGLFSERLERKLQQMLKNIPKEQPLIVMNHFPVFQGNRPQRHQMKRFESLRAILEEHPNIMLYLYGHTHKSEFSSSHPLMINSGSLTLSKQGSFHLMDLSPTHLEVETYNYMNQTWKVTSKRSLSLPALALPS